MKINLDMNTFVIFLIGMIVALMLSTEITEVVLGWIGKLVDGLSRGMGNVGG